MKATNKGQRMRQEIFLLDRDRSHASKFTALHPQLVSSSSKLPEFLARARKDSLWVSYRNDLTRELVKNVAVSHPTLGFGLFIHSVDAKTIPVLASCFRRIAFTTDGGFLPAEELADVLESERRGDLFIGGSVNNATKTITFWRGNLDSITVSFSAFEPSGDGTRPDFGKFSIIDGGQTVQLGRYETAIDAILYEFDPEYRRRITKKHREKDQTFGASLRRLRNQRGLRREDFEPDISAKTVARIEQGKIRHVRKKTLDALAERLAVDPQEIGEF